MKHRDEKEVGYLIIERHGFPVLEVVVADELMSPLLDLLHLDHLKEVYGRVEIQTWERAGGQIRGPLRRDLHSLLSDVFR